MERHCSNAQVVAEFLNRHDKGQLGQLSPAYRITAYHALAQKYMPKGTCGVISFGVKGGREAAVRFMDALKLASIVTHVADSKTCVLHPASTTHRQMNDAQLEAAGVAPDLVRLSVGLEHIDDILADLSQALEKA